MSSPTAKRAIEFRKLPFLPFCSSSILVLIIIIYNRSQEKKKKREKKLGSGNELEEVVASPKSENVVTEEEVGVDASAEVLYATAISKLDGGFSEERYIKMVEEMLEEVLIRLGDIKASRSHRRIGSTPSSGGGRRSNNGS